MSGNQGLGSNNMSDADKAKIHKAGGKASHSGGSSSRSGEVTTNHAGGGALDKEAQRKGGQNSHRS